MHNGATLPEQQRSARHEARKLPTNLHLCRRPRPEGRLSMPATSHGSSARTSDRP